MPLNSPTSRQRDYLESERDVRALCSQIDRAACESIDDDDDDEEEEEEKRSSWTHQSSMDGLGGAVPEERERG